MIYFDSAATTLQKPKSVSSAVAGAIVTMASPGRGGHRPAQEAARVAFACREAAADLFGLSNPEQVVFTFNATHALNIAIKSLVKNGDTVLISGYEHNAVTRPLYSMPDVKVKVALLTPEVRVVVCTHVSNVFGYILPVEEIAALCAKRGVPLIVDASQSAGCVPIDMTRWGAAFVAMPGHKGLYGPQGTGLLLCAGEARPLIEGGTGSNSALQQMPDFLPDRLEAGTHNIHGIAGLREGLAFVRQKGVEQIGRKECHLIAHMAGELQNIGGVHTFARKPGEQCQSGVLSFVIEGLDCEEVGYRLAQQGIAVRSGLHCAPLAHETVGTLESGTVRASVSAFNTEREAECLIRAVKRAKK